MTGEQNAAGRSGCLKAEEVDPLGIAQPCVTPTATASVQAAPSAVTLPSVGSGLNGAFIALIWAVAIAACVYAVTKRNDRWK